MVQDALDGAASWKMVYEKTHDYAHVEQIQYARLPVNAQFELDLHRPYTDDIVLLDDVGVEYLRIPEVVDCWVESGSMPFAEYHYPFENKDVFEKRAPGDFIAEYIAQTRTWFYYMHAMGVLLFNRLAFKSVVSTGNILGNDGLKMSKSKGNYTDPLLVVDQFGADAYRFHLMGSVVMQSEDFVFRDQDVRDAHNRTVGILWNTFKFFDLYQKEYDGRTRAHASSHMLDRWILARLDEVINEMTAAMDAYDTPRACRVLKAFVDDYSTWYVRRSRDRMKSQSHDKQYSLATQREVLLTFAKLIAPLMPFIAESIWRGIEKEGSVHLATWPEVHRGLWARIFGTQKPDGLLKDMAHARATVSRALEARDKAGLKVRQSLQSLTVRVALSRELQEIVAEEVNVKNILVNASTPEGEVRLDTEITPELKEEGDVRELLRAIQDARKKAGLQQGQTAKVRVKSALGVVVEKHKDELQKQTSTEIQSEAGEVLEVTIL